MVWTFSDLGAFQQESVPYSQTRLYRNVVDENRHEPVESEEG